MKKIIYSFVIMIAAGSLFTSCVTNTEPQGVKDLREAKADYLASLSKLREADAEKVKAEAAVEQAKAAIKQAKAAQEQAIAKALELANDSLSLANEQKAAEVAAEIAKIKAKAEYDAVIAEQNLATAQDNLRKALADIAAEAEKLTTKEQQVVTEYKTAYDKFISAQDGVYKAEKELWAATNEYKTDWRSKSKSLEQRKAGYEKEIADAQAKIAELEATIKEKESKSEADKLTYGIWKDEYDSYADSVKYLEFQTAQIEKDRSYYQTEVAPAFQSFLKALEKAQESVTKAVDAVGFKMDLTGDDAYELPEQDIKAGSVVEAFKSAVGDIPHEQQNFVQIDNKGKLAVKADNQKAIAKKIFGDAEHPENASLSGIIDALQRELVVTDQYVKDTTGLGALVAATLADYKATKDTLVAGRDAYEPYVKAKDAYNDVLKASNTKKAAAIDALKDLVASVNAAQKDQKNRKNNDITDKHIDSLENALVNYGVAVFDYFGKTVRDSVSIIAYDEETGELIQNAKRALKEIKRTDFVPKQRNGKYRTIFSEGADAEKAQYAAYNVVLNAIKGTNVNYFLAPVDYTSENIKEFNKVFDKGWGIGTHDGKSAKAVWYECLTISKKTDFYLSTDQNKTFSYAGLAAAEKTQNDRKSDFYTKIYEHFWGVAFNTSADSLKINYNEKTYTEPYIIPDFTFTSESFVPAEGKTSARFEWTTVDYNSNNKELLIINDQLKQTSNGHEVNNLEVKKNGTRVGWTLYAKVLATAQFENEAKYYVENKEALEELAEIVEDVEDVYAEACENIEEKQSLADSLVTEYVGEDIIEFLLEGGDENVEIENAADLWKHALKDCYVIPVTTTQKTFKSNGWIKAGEYDFSGYQLEAAEAILGDYAACINDWDVKEVQIAADKQYCNTLQGYLNAYVQALYRYEKEKTSSGNVDQIYAAVQKAWKDMIDGLKEDISTEKGKIETAELALAKIAAGFDDQQVTIAAKESALAKAKALLEQREVELAIAEAAYKAVLAAHGITE